MNNVESNLFYQCGRFLIKHNSQSIYVGTRRFKEFFGVSPSICSTVWNLIKNELSTDYKEVHLLWALMFLKCYHTESVNRSIAICDEKTFRKRAWEVIDKLAFMKVIEWEDRKIASNQSQTCFVSLDGVDFRINEPQPFHRKWYSHKFKGPGLRYEIGLCIRSGHIVWKYGGFPCGDWPDLRIARHLFIDFLEPGEKALADKGYNDNTYFILPTDKTNKHQAIMSRHETINKRIKQFNVLKQTFRHNLVLHKKCFNAVLNLTQLIIKSEEPLFTI